MLPVWGTAAILVAPSAPVLSTGFVAGNTLPSQWWNFQWFHLTKELNNVLTAAGIGQSAAVDTQLIQAIRTIRNNLVITSGTLGVLTVTDDTTYILTAASTATLPASPQSGCRLTFKAKTNATSTISANAGQTIGTTTSTSFSLYAQEDYVTLEWDGTSIWYVVATNGPVQTANQSSQGSCNASSAWTAIGVGVTLGTVAPGVYDLELLVTPVVEASGLISIAIGNGTSPISETAPFSGPTQNVTVPIKVTLKGYVLSAAATIQGLYYSNSSSSIIAYNTSYGAVAKITARRIG